MRVTPSRFVFVLTAVVFGLALGHDAAGLPETMATHFDAAGGANGTMAARSYLAFYGFLGLGMSLFLIGACYAIRLFPATSLTVPNEEYWHRPENHARACRFLLEHSFWIASLNLLWLLLLHREIVAANRLPVPFLSPERLTPLGWLYGGGMVVWIGMIGWYFGRVRERD